jgi:hypothetical protein
MDLAIALFNPLDCLSSTRGQSTLGSFSAENLLAVCLVESSRRESKPIPPTLISNSAGFLAYPDNGV